jgi:membrane-bound lytic murein transglycosylase B
MTIPDQITAAANAAGVPAWLALAIAQRESGFNNNAVGSAGEIGIFQLLPSTAAQLGVDPADPVQNIAGGVAYIAQLLRTFGGDAQKAAAAFNCGPTCVAHAVAASGDAWAAHIPSSTQAYVAGVTGSLPLLPAASPDATVPAVPPVSAGIPPPPGTFDWQPFAYGSLALMAFLTLRGIGQRA